MLTVEKLSKKPSLFKSFTGLTVEDFQKLANQMEEAQRNYDKKRLGRPNRQRVIGGGRKFKLLVAEQLLMLLMYYRLYTTYALLGFLFDLDQSNISRNIDYIKGLFKQFLPLPKRLIPDRKKLESFAELILWYPQLRAVVDTTEQAIPRPKDKDKQKRYYSGKKKRHTVKSQVLSNKWGLILDVFSGVEGKRHDFMVIQDSQIDKQLPDLVGIEGDRAYQGLEKVLPGRTCYLPFKASRGNPLTELQRWINKIINGGRVVIEHSLSWIKKFRILKDIFRNKLNKYPEVFEIIAGIVNLKTMKRLGMEWK